MKSPIVADNMVVTQSNKNSISSPAQTQSLIPPVASNSQTLPPGQSLSAQRSPMLSPKPRGMPLKSSFSQPNLPQQMSALSPNPMLQQPMIAESQDETTSKSVTDSGMESEEQKQKKTTPQQRLQQKLMSEALKRVETKKDRSKHFSNITRTNPTIFAMEIMTRKEICAGDMERRLARGEVPDIPVPPTPVHMKEGNNKQLPANKEPTFIERLAAQPKMGAKTGNNDLKRSESMKIEKPITSPKPSVMQKRLSHENIAETIPPVIVLKKQPKRLDPAEIKMRVSDKEKRLQSTSPERRRSNSHLVNKEVQDNKQSSNNIVKEPVKAEPRPVTKEARITSTQQQQPLAISAHQKEKLIKASLASKASISPKMPQPSMPTTPKQSKAERVFELVQNEKQQQKKQQLKTKPLVVKPEPIEQPNETVKKAAELYEKTNTTTTTKERKKSQSQRQSGPDHGQAPQPKFVQQMRSKSIGNLAMKLQMAAANASAREEEMSAGKILPWAAQDDSAHHRISNPGIRKHIASRDKGYQLRMSKSSDSITAAKLLAEQRMQDQRQPHPHQLRINKDMSKSIERQIDVYTKTREDIRKILDVAKACTVQQKIKLFNEQEVHEVNDTRDREERAEAIRREILEAKESDKKQASGTGSGSDIQIQSPVEVKVKPLKIPMKPKLIGDGAGTGSGSGAPPTGSSVPGSTLRINQPSGGKQPEVKSILRTSRSTERGGARGRSAYHTDTEADKQIRRSSMETINVGSVKGKITEYLQTAEQKDEPASSLAKGRSSPEFKPKSILVKKGRERSRNKTPKLIHSNSMKETTTNQHPNIYAQSATDISDEESLRLRKKSSVGSGSNQNGQFLTVPEEKEKPEKHGLRKSKSFATPGQFECALSDQEVNDKQRTIMAFFDTSLGGGSGSGSVSTSGPSAIQRSEVVKRNPAIAAALKQKRGSITSISDEILGDDCDLRDVDAVFESLLNNTFEEIQARGREMASVKQGRRGRRSASSHQTPSRIGVESGLLGSDPKASADNVSGSRKKGGGGGSSVNRKQSKSKLLAGEVKSVINASGDPNAGTTSMMSKDGVKADPVGNLPTSHTKKYLPRQMTSPPPATPSPTQSEYDTCDPWEDY